MNKLNAAKGIIGFGIGISVGQVIGNLVVATLPPTAKIHTKILTRVGGFAITSVVSGFISERVDAKLDETVVLVQAAKNEITNIKKNMNP